MARVRIPPVDVPPIEIDPVTKQFRWTADWYDVLKALERLRLIDLADVTTAVPADTNTVRYSASSSKWNFGA
ncbi:hypothetical protein [Bradyrhizobium sp. C9]|uniref:hypothetical protein n=1 Tax=Bradyrhizobium sp. C9 TaxID=142585 RepID=UPI00117809D8|nr:hypothetical protein [Bradyrhizobium sp. C9]